MSATHAVRRSDVDPLFESGFRHGRAGHHVTPPYCDDGQILNAFAAGQAAGALARIDGLAATTAVVLAAYVRFQEGYSLYASAHAANERPTP